MMSNFWILQLQPCQVARKVIIAEQRIGPQPKKLCERRIITKFGRRPQSFRRRLQKSAKRNSVGNRLQFFVLPPHDRELIVDRRLLIRMLLDVLLHLIPRQVRRIKSSPRRNRLRPDKRFILVKQIEARGVNPQVATQFAHRAGSGLDASDWYSVSPSGSLCRQ